MNSRHPSRRRVWKVGSGARLLTPLPRYPWDRWDPIDLRMRSETSIFSNPSVTFGHLAGQAPPQIRSTRLWRQSEALGRPGGALGQLWELWGSSRDSIYTPHSYQLGYFIFHNIPLTPISIYPSLLSAGIFHLSKYTPHSYQLVMGGRACW